MHGRKTVGHGGIHGFITVMYATSIVLSNTAYGKVGQIGFQLKRHKLGLSALTGFEWPPGSPSGC